jgi:hypothetical protein
LIADPAQNPAFLPGQRAAARRVEATRDDTLHWSGRLLAALHDTHHLSWPAIARLTGIPQSTAHRRAQPYLTPAPDEGGNP